MAEGRTRRRIRTIAGVALAGYLALCLVARVAYPRMLFPAPRLDRAPPVEDSSAKLVELPQPDGSRTAALHFPAATDARTVIVFHGNGETMFDNVGLAAELVQRGVGVLLVEYRGYGTTYGSGSPPTEEMLYEDGEAAIAYLARAGVPAERVALWGWSLGTGVAAEMARRGHGTRLVLIAPYTSITDMGRRVAPILPVSLLMAHRLDTLSKAGAIKTPTLVVHGDADALIPLAMGEAVASAIPGARLVRVAGGHHADLLSAYATGRPGAHELLESARRSSVRALIVVRRSARRFSPCPRSRSGGALQVPSSIGVASRRRSAALEGPGSRAFGRSPRDGHRLLRRVVSSRARREEVAARGRSPSRQGKPCGKDVRAPRPPSSRVLAAPSGVDPIAEHLVPTIVARLARPRERRAWFDRWPAVELMRLRTLAIDEVVDDGARQGIRQLVVLGAGLCARAWRMPALSDSIVYEVDHPATQRYKRTRLDGLVAKAREVRLVGVDFEQDDLALELERAGHEAGAPTTWIWEGVTPYLTPQAIAGTLKAIRTRSADGSVLVVTYGTPDLARVGARGRVVGGRMARWVMFGMRMIGEPFLGLMDVEAMHRLLREEGFDVKRDSTYLEVASRLGLPAPRFVIGERVLVAVVGAPDARTAPST